MNSFGRLKRKRTTRLFMLISIVLMIGSACALPSIRLPFVVEDTPPPVEQKSVENPLPTAPPTLAAAPVTAAPPTATPDPNLPPALLEAQPQTGSVVGALDGFTFYFSQPMDIESVQRGLEINPPFEAEFTWLDDATLRLTAAEPLPASTDLRLRFNSNVRARSGAFLNPEVELNYRTTDPLGLIEQLPRPQSREVNPAAAVVAAFSQPVVPLFGEDTDRPAGFTLDPPAGGRGEWLNTTTYIFYPEPALEGATDYSVQVNAELTGLPEDSGWTFRTARPSVELTSPGSLDNVRLDSEFVFQFNQPVDRAVVERALTLQPADGEAVAGSFEWQDDDTQVVFQPTELLARNGQYIFRVAAPEIGLGDDYYRTIETVGDFAVASTEPAEGQSLQIFENNYAALTVHFTAPLDKDQDLDELVQIAPPVLDFNISVVEDDNRIIIGGFFEPATNYTVVLDAALSDRWGQSLGETQELEFRTATAQPSLTVPMLQAGTNILFVRPEDTDLPARATNIETVEMNASSLALEDFLRISADPYEAEWPPVMLSWQQMLDQPANVSQPVEIALSEDGGELDPGLYAFTISSPEAASQPRYQPTRFMVVVSNTALHLKRSPTELFIWATGVSSRQPLDGVEITVYDQTGAPLGTAVTENGVTTLALPEELNEYTPLYAVIGQPGEQDFSLASTRWNQGTSVWEFGLSYYPSGKDAMAYVYTDRPIYRPGQAVSFRAVARREQNGRYTLLDRGSLTIKINAPTTGYETNTVYSQQLPLTSFGSVEGTFTLPEDALPGEYRIEIEEIESAVVFFRVAEYRKPTLEALVSFDEDVIGAGTDVNADINVAYYFGAPAADVDVSWTLIARRAYFSIPGRYQTGKYDTDWINRAYQFSQPFGRFIASGTDSTDENGTLNVTIPAGDLAEAIDLEQGYTLELEVTAQDESGQPVSARAEARLHPASFYIGVRPESWSGQADAEFGFDVQLVDWETNPAGAVPLLGSFQRVTWKPEDEGSIYTSPMVPEYTTVGSVDFQTDLNGRARLAFTPPVPGTYMLDVRGQGAVTQVLVWVGGAGADPWPKLPNQQLRLTADAESYQPGQTARIFVPSPYPDGATALLTVERGKVMRWQVLEISGASTTVELPLEQDDAPNVYISVLLLGENEDGNPDFRQGYVELAVDPAQQLLNINLASQPQRAAPGEEVQFALRVTDAQGNPVQGEFSLAVVDKAALALADPNAEPINDAFYGPQPLGVMTSTPLSAFSRRLVLIQPGRGGGGGGSMEDSQVRDEFADTALWRGSIVTDAEGFAQVSAALPDNLTTWVVDVRGVDADTRTGQAVLEVTSSKMLMVQPVTPRFFVAGDHARLSALVINNTDQALDAQVSLQAEGFTLDEPAQSTQSVSLEARGRQAVNWWGTAQPVEQVRLLFTAEGGGLRDSVTPEAGDLPVLVFSAPETFGAAGMLAEAGARQELVGLPKSFEPTGGELEVELSPSLAAALISGLETYDDNLDSDMPVTLASQLLPNVEIYNTLTSLGVDNPGLKASVDAAAHMGISGLVRMQNSDGGWGWAEGSDSQAYLSGYIYLALSRAQQAGYAVPESVITSAHAYLHQQMAEMPTREAWEQDRFVLINWALEESRAPSRMTVELAEAWRPNLSPWSKALLAVMMQDTDSELSGLLLQDLRDATVRTATGAHWEDTHNARWNNASTSFTTAVVTYALARLDPASPLLVDAVRYLASTRSSSGAWYSPYDTAWVLIALSEALKGTGDVQGDYAFSAALNGAMLAEGQAQGENAFNPVVTQAPLSRMNPDALNPLVIQRGEGSGRLYYRAYLRVDRPVESAAPVNKGMSLTRTYTVMDSQGCAQEGCPPVEEVALGVPAPVVLVRLSLTLPNDVSHLVVEDFIPAGAEILDSSLKTSQEILTEPTVEEEYDPRNPFAKGWGWWYFHSPKVYDTHVRWTAENVPAGTYQLVYRLVILQPGEYRLIPARAYNYYFPEVQGTSAGSIFTIQPE